MNGATPISSEADAMVYLITIELPDELAQNWVDENQGFKDNDDDPETLKGCVEELIWNTLDGSPEEEMKKIRVETWRLETLTDLGIGIDAGQTMTRIKKVAE